MTDVNTWRLLPLAAERAARHMAIDEALLEVGGDEPVLRLYTWEPAALSLGWFQDERETQAACAALPAGHDVVRRFTGGGAIHHAHELTFSIAAPIDHALYVGPVAASYERVHGAIARALATLDIAADLRRARTLASERQGTGMCFHHSSSVDLVWAGPDGLAKGVGSAQRRRAGRVLHHGSIKIAADPLEPGVATVVAARSTGAAALKREEGRLVERLAAALKGAFEQTFGAKLVESALTAREAEQAARRTPHFGSPANLAPTRRRGGT